MDMCKRDRRIEVTDEESESAEQLACRQCWGGKVSRWSMRRGKRWLHA